MFEVSRVGRGLSIIGEQATCVSLSDKCLLTFLTLGPPTSVLEIILAMT